MITGKLRNDIDRLWTEFWTGGITNPLTVIEQISFLLYARMLDLNETRNEKVFRRKNKGKEFPGEIFPKHRDPKKNRAHLRWETLCNAGDAEAMHATVRDELFPFLRELAETRGSFGAYMKDASLMITTPRLLRRAMEMINELPLDRGDTKGDLYEYLLSKLTTAGINGQFRTPRHIIRLMAELVDPKPTEVIGDPSCGTAGFLVGALEHINRAHSSKDEIGAEDANSEGIELHHYPGDLLKPEERRFLNTRAIHGFDFDVTMLRIAAMNLMLHGIDNPNIQYQDTLGSGFTERFPKESEGFFDVILANPPFTGALDEGDVHPALAGMVKTKKTELLFLALILRMLKPFGRCASIVPTGVLFGSNKANVALRKILVENNQLDAVISMPSGVFKPYAGVATAILLFTKTNSGGTDDVWFYDTKEDGFTLDDKRTPQPEKSDLADILARWQKRKAEKKRTRADQSFMVPKAEIADNNYNLDINTYKELEYEAVEYDPPKVILKRLAELEDEIAQGRAELEGLLG